MHLARQVHCPLGLERAQGAEPQDGITIGSSNNLDPSSQAQRKEQVGPEPKPKCAKKVDVLQATSSTSDVMGAAGVKPAAGGQRLGPGLPKDNILATLREHL